MRAKKTVAKLFLLAVFASFQPFSGMGADDVTEAAQRRAALAEAPSSLLPESLNSSGVELLLQGFWKTGIGGYLTLGPGSQYALDDLSQTDWFNSVDLLLSLWIQGQYYVEGHFADGFTPDYFDLGYEAPSSGPGLRRVRIGNNGIVAPGVNLTRYPDLAGKISDQETSSGLGALAWWTTPVSSHLLMLALENTEPMSEVFSSAGNSVKVSVDATHPISAQFFQLPYQRVKSVQVYVQDNAGVVASDGSSYRELTQGELEFIDLAGGRIGLKSPPGGRVAVVLELDNSSNPASFPGLDSQGNLLISSPVAFSPATSGAFETSILTPLASRFGVGTGTINGLKLTVGGKSAWILSDGTSWSPFADLSWYPYSGASGAKSARYASTGSELTILDQRTSAIRIGFGQTTAIQERYPLRQGSLGSHALDYLPGGLRVSGESIIVTSSDSSPASGSNSGLVLSRSAIEGSMTVYRNGVFETGWTYDAASKTIHLDHAIGALDSVEVRYLSAIGGIGTGTMALSFRNAFTPLDGINLWAHLDASIPISSTDPGELFTVGTSVGSIFKFPSAGIDASVAGSATVSFGSSLPGYRLEGFENSVTQLEGNAQNLVISEAPVASVMRSDLLLGGASLTPVSVADLSALTAQLLTASFATSNRGSLVYRNLSLGNSAFATWDSASNYPVQTGASGPYIAAVSSGSDKKVAVSEFSVDSAKPWAAWDMKLDEDARNNISTTAHVSLTAALSAMSGKVAILVSIEDAGEDIDGDGVIAEGHAGQSGLPLNLNTGQTLAYPAVANTLLRTLSEDIDGNGRLDPGHVAQSARRLVGVFTADSSDAVLDWTLTDSERARIAHCSSLRFTFVAMSPAASGSFRVHDIFYDATGVSVASPDTSNTVSALRTKSAEEQDELSSLKLGFLSDSLSVSGAQLKVSWTASAAQSTVLVATRSFSPASWKSMNLALKTLNSQNLGVHLSMRDDDEVLAESDISLATSGWHRVEISFAEGKVTCYDQGGAFLSSSAMTLHRSGTVNRISITFTSASPSSIILDEFELRDALDRLDLKGRANFSWSSGRPLLDDGNVRFVGPLSVSSSLYTGAGLGLETNSWAGTVLPEFRWQSHLKAELLYLSFDVAGTLDNAEATQGGVTWSIETPRNFPVAVSDIVETRVDPGLSSWRKKNTFTESSGFPLEFRLESREDTQTLTKRLETHIGTLPKEGFGLEVLGSYNNARRASAFDQSLGGLISAAYASIADWSESDLVSRDTGASVEMKWSGQPIDASVKAELAVGQKDPLNPVTSEKFGSSARFRIGSDSDPLRLSFAYSRAFQRDDAVGVAAWQDEMLNEFQSLALLPEDIVAIPFYEWFDPDLAGRYAIHAGAESASLTSKASLTFDRPLDTTATAFLIPSLFTFEMGRSLASVAATASDKLFARQTLAWKAINLLGSGGTLGMNPGFQNDSWNYGLSWYADLANPASGAWSTYVQAELYGLSMPLPSTLNLSRIGEIIQRLKSTSASPDSISLRFGLANATSSQWNSNVGIGFSWVAGLPFFQPNLFGKESKGPAFLGNTESFSFSIASGLEPGAFAQNAAVSEVLSAAKNSLGSDGLKVSLKHETVFYLPGLAYVSATIGIAFQTNWTEPTNRAGFYGGLEAKIIF